jgi:hypothetical protein
MMADNMDWRTNQRLRMYELYVQMKMRELQESGEWNYTEEGTPCHHAIVHKKTEQACLWELSCLHV